jgi:outer membrane protein OmpA-like peptidoglycan-associated protein
MPIRMMTVAAMTAVLGSSVACATKGYVRTEIYPVNEKVDSLSSAVEQTQERTRKNEVRIDQVDQKATQIDQKADRAGLWAKDASMTANNALAKAEAVDHASKKLLFEVVLSENDGNFAFGHVDLPEPARQHIDQLIDQLKSDPRGAFIEIEGHTDSTGSKVVNDYVGLARAESVKRYLHEKHGIPLHKMNVISYGKDQPIATNNTREGRARNRRVVIKILT